MKNPIRPLVLAISLGLIGSVQATTIEINDFRFGLAERVLDEDYDFNKDCKRDCKVAERQTSVEFWHNTVIGEVNAQGKLQVTPATQTAARFLMQATFGPTVHSINQLSQRIEADGEQAALEVWLDAQMAAPSSNLADLVSNQTDWLQTTAWWHQSLTAPDQLRQRVTFALNHVMTISLTGALTKDGTLADYYGMLSRNAFGNFRQLLGDVTYHIGMNIYLDNIHNSARKQANENYARELMQLFALGTEQLNLDGTPKLDAAGNPLPTYSEQDVVELAKALSGFSRGGQWYGPAKLKQKNHFTGTKTLFEDTPQEVVLLGSSARADVEEALDAIFNHPNVGPFIATRLIQHLVTSNPSPDYVARVAAAFNDNGQGRRGDMEAVVHAVLMDIEARDPASVEQRFYGKLKEPVLRLSNLLRAVPNNPYSNARSPIQTPLNAPSVFSFFQPDDTQAGEIEMAGKVAPEFNLLTDTNQAKTHNHLHRLIFERGYSRKVMKKGKYTRWLLDNDLDAALNDVPALVDKYNLLLMGGSMDSNMQQKIVSFVSGLPTEDGGEERVRTMLYLIMTSSQQAIQH